MQKANEFLLMYGDRDPGLMPQLTMFARQFGLSEEEFREACKTLSLVTPPPLPPKTNEKQVIPPPLPVDTKETLSNSADIDLSHEPAIDEELVDPILGELDESVIEAEEVRPKEKFQQDQVENTAKTIPISPHQAPPSVKSRFLQKVKLILAHTGGWSNQTLMMVYQEAAILGISTVDRDQWIDELRTARGGKRKTKRPRTIPLTQPVENQASITQSTQQAAPVSNSEEQKQELEQSDTTNKDSQAKKQAKKTVTKSERNEAQELKDKTQAAEKKAVEKKRKIKELSPSDTFRVYLKKAFRALRTNKINASRERKLIKEGVDKLGISEILASDLLEEMAEKMNRVIVTRIHTPAESQEEEQQQELITDFQQRAASIIAGQGGVNSISRAMIANVAADLGLSEQQRESALAMIQQVANEQEKDDKTQQRNEAYRQFLIEKLEHIEQGIVSAKVARQLVQIGIDLHGLDESVAEITLKNAVQDEDLRLISHQQAAKHLQTIVDDLLDEEDHISDENRVRVNNEGLQWGLTPKEISEILSESADAYQLRQRKAQSRTSKVLFCIFSGVIVGLFFTGYYLHSLPNRDDYFPTLSSNKPDDVDPIENTLEKKKPEEVQWGRQPWWDESFTLEMVTLYNNHPEFHTDLKAICSQDALERQSAYINLVNAMLLTATSDKDSSVNDLFSRALQGMFQSEPNEAAASKISEALLTSIPASDTMLQKNNQLSRAVVAVEFLSRLYNSDADYPDRNQDLIASSENKLGLTIVDPQNFQKIIFEEFIRNQFRHLSRLAEEDVSQAIGMQTNLVNALSGKLDQQTLNNLNLNLTIDILPNSSSVWSSYQANVQQLILSRDPKTILQLIDLYQFEIDDRSLQLDLGTLLSRYLAVNIDNLPADQAAAIMREKLGGNSISRNSQDQWRYFWNRGKSILLEQTETKNKEELLIESVDLANLSLLGHAVAQKDLGVQLFNQLIADGPSKLEPASIFSSPSTTSRRTLPARPQDLIRSLTLTQDSPIRITIYNSLSSLAGDVVNIDYQSAVDFAKYIIRPKPNREQEVIVKSLASFSHWDNLKLALADTLPMARRDKEDLQELVGVILSTAFTEEENAQTVLHLQRSLIQSVINQQNVDRTFLIGLNDKLLDEGSSMLTDIYAKHAKLLGIGRDQLLNKQLPGEVLQLIIEVQIQKLNGQNLSSELKEAVSAIDQQQQLTSYLTEGDHALFVMQQRNWLKLISIEIQHQEAQKGAESQQIIQELSKLDSQSKNIFQQLRNGEAALIQMWLVKAQP